MVAAGLWSAARLAPDNSDVLGLYSSVDCLTALSDEHFDHIAAAVENKIDAVIGGVPNASKTNA